MARRARAQAVRGPAGELGLALPAPRASLSFCPRPRGVAGARPGHNPPNRDLWGLGGGCAAPPTRWDGNVGRSCDVACAATGRIVEATCQRCRNVAVNACMHTACATKLVSNHRRPLPRIYCKLPHSPRRSLSSTRLIAATSSVHPLFPAQTTETLVRFSIWETATRVTFRWSCASPAAAPMPQASPGHPPPLPTGLSSAPPPPPTARLELMGGVGVAAATQRAPAPPLRRRHGLGRPPLS